MGSECKVFFVARQFLLLVQRKTFESWGWGRVGEQTIAVCASTQQLGGAGDMLPQEMLEMLWSEIASEALSVKNCHFLQFTFSSRWGSEHNKCRTGNAGLGMSLQMSKL